jgi:hypothetical protein
MKIPFLKNNRSGHIFSEIEVSLIMEIRLTLESSNNKKYSVEDSDFRQFFDRLQQTSLI